MYILISRVTTKIRNKKKMHLWKGKRGNYEIIKNIINSKRAKKEYNKGQKSAGTNWDVSSYI